MHLSFNRNNIKLKLFFIGMATIQCFYMNAQNSDILSDIMNGQLDDYELINQKKINTSELEFAPTMYRDSIVYVANGRASGKKSKSQARSYFNLYTSAIDGLGNLVSETSLPGVLNSVYHEGPLTYSKDGLEVFFTRNNQVEGASAQRKMNLSIYKSNKINGVWSPPSEMFKSSSEYSFCHPTLNSSGDRLYFSSNLPGGYGGYDIYYIEMVSGIWSNPINTGAAVNTGDNELFPTFLGDEVLSFSSNRPGGIGGLDIYVTELKEGKGYDTQMLSSPVNSAADDMSLVINQNTGIAYFSSARSGGAGQDDIYSIKAKKLKEAVSINQIFVILDSLNNKRLNNVRVMIKGSEGNLISEGLTDKNGMLTISLMENNPYKAIIAANDFPEVEIPFVAGDKKTIRLQQAPCLKLSGIAQDPENSKLLDSVEFLLTLQCDGRVLKARTDKDGRFEFCIPSGCEGFLSADVDEYYPAIMEIKPMTDNLLINVNFNKEKLSIVKGQLKTGSVMVLENIYFDFNQSTIRTGTERELNELVTLMKQYPEMVIDIISHTDSRGENKENLNLSIQRAASMKEYLVEKGVSADRIETQGRGETQPRNRCKDGVNCTEEEHQFNRRTEVKVLKK